MNTRQRARSARADRLSTSRLTRKMSRGQGVGSRGGCLEQLALFHRIQLSYEDMRGRRQTASPECLRSVLEALGVAAGNDRECQESLREAELRKWRQALDPVIVAWEGRATKARVRLPAKLLSADVSLRLLMEAGNEQELRWRPGGADFRGRADINGLTFVEGEVPLPVLPRGYHHLQLELRGRRHECLVISAPEQTYSDPAERRSWGLFLPMYAVHSARSWGAGDVTDYGRLCLWARRLGGEVVATLPLLAAFLDHPCCEASPYSPVSRLFWNEFYLDIRRIPEFSTCAAARKLEGSASFQRRLADFRRAPVIDFRAEMSARRAVLERLAKSFFSSGSSRRREYDAFLQRQPLARDYAEFRATCDHQKVPWGRWEARLGHGKLQPGDYEPSVRDYHLYCQWMVQEQMCTLLEGWARGEGRFHLDLPLGVHPDGYDVWRMKDAFASSATAGAPPDMFFTKGQNWGFPPLHPHHIRQRGYAYVRDYLRFQMRHTGLLRLDHVMGLHRLYWIPEGAPADQGAYVRYPAEELFAILCLESQRNKTVIIGENLGTVPPEVTAAMRRHGLRETYVAQYAQRADPGRALAPPPKKSVAMLNTHDLPPFAAHWKGGDIRKRLELGLISKGEARAAALERAKQRETLMMFLRRHRCLAGRKTDAITVAQACLKWLAGNPVETLLINLEDLWGEDRPQNLPGIVNRLNWRRKARLTLEEIEASGSMGEFLRRIGSIRTVRSRARGDAGKS